MGPFLFTGKHMNGFTRVAICLLALTVSVQAKVVSKPWGTRDSQAVTHVAGYVFDGSGCFIVTLGNGQV